MTTLADALSAVTDGQLLELVRAGHVAAAEVLIQRLDGRPPVAGIPDGMLAAVVWADLLTGRLAPALATSAGRANDARPASVDPTPTEALT